MGRWAPYYAYDGGVAPEPGQGAPGVPPGVEAFFDVAREALLLVDCASLRIVSVNAAAAQLYGHAAEALRGQSFDKLISEHPQAADFLAHRRRHLPLVFHYRRGDVRFPAEIFASYFAQGDSELAVLHVRDLSESAQQELSQLDSDQKYQAIFNSSPFPIFLISQLGLIIDANPRTVTLYGYTREQLVGMRVAQLIVGEPGLPNLFLTQPARFPACDHRRSNGARFIAETSLSYIRSPRQMVAVAVVRDVTEERRYLGLLQESEQRWRFALEGAGDGVWDWDLARNAINASPQCLQIIDADLDQDLNPLSLWPERVHPADRDLVAAAFKAHLQGQLGLVDIDFRAECGARGMRWLSLRGKIMSSAEGGPMRMIGTLRDVHEQYVQKERDRLQQGDLAHAGRLITIGEMASALAHEINQPLTALRNFSAVCLRRAGDEAYAKQDLLEPLQMISDQALRAGEIVQRIRRFVQKGQVGFTNVDLNEVVRDIVRLIEVDARAQAVKIELELAPSLSPTQGDAIQLGQVVVNLVKNGMEAMRDVMGEKRLLIQTREAQGWVEASVIDHGCGIAPDVQDALFVPFVTTKTDGMGLGLAICHSIVEAHCGQLRASSVEGEGTTFVLRLPATKRELAQGG